jgi:hypothetical protein
MRTLLVILSLSILGCGTRLSATDIQAEQATRAIGAAGFEAHSGDVSGMDLIRFQSIYCNSGGILLRAGQTVSAVDGGPQCPSVAP